MGNTAAVNARDRIGAGPWRNAKGAVIAKSVDDLHGPENNLTKQTALTEKGEPVNGRGDTPNMHDILTGSQPDGRAFPVGDQDTTCGNWTKGGEGSAVVGHHDRMGLRDDDASKSWNSSHGSRGCEPRCAEGDRRQRAVLLLCRELRSPPGHRAQREKPRREEGRGFTMRVELTPDRAYFRE